MPDGFAGMSWIGFEIDIAEDEDDAQADLVSVVMNVMTNSDLTGTPSLTLSSGDGITINSATPPWNIGIDDIETLSLAAGIYFFDIQFTDSTGMTEALLGGTWRINPAT